MDKEEKSETKEAEKEALERVIKNELLKVEMKQTEGFFRFNWTNQQNLYLNNSIRFADTKAGALVAINGLVLKFVSDLLATSLHGISGMLLKIGLFTLIASILSCLMVVYPRLLNSKDKGLIYWEQVNNYGKEDYIEAVTSGEIKNLMNSSIQNNFYQAKILTTKFKQLRIGFIISILGYLFVTAALVIKYYFAA